MKVMLTDPEPWTPTKDELEEIIEKHNIWLETDGEDGDRADLSSVDLSFSKVNSLNDNLWGKYISKGLISGTYDKQPVLDFDLPDGDIKQSNLSRVSIHNKDWSGSTLQKADLSESTITEVDLTEARLVNAEATSAYLRRSTFRNANLSGANFWEANLAESSFRNADLTGATLYGANLSEADFRGANLHNANLRGSTGLEVQAMARANTSNAKLPERIANFEGLKVVKAASQSARRLFISLGFACAFSVLSLIQEGDFRLPIIDVPVSLEYFYYVVPPLLTGGFFYFQLQMQRLWELISGLPAVFPDGMSVDEKVHPWLITGIAREHTPYLRENLPDFFSLQKVFAIFLAWAAVPSTILYFVASYSAQFPDDVLISGGGALLLALTVSGAVHSYRIAVRTLRGEGSSTVRLKQDLTEDEEEVSDSYPEPSTIFWTLGSFVVVFVAWALWLAALGV